MMRNIIKILLIFTGIISYAQLKIKAPNSDAISIFNFTESPVSLHTGLVNINYPIYEIKTQGLTIPITLSYFSRGVKVEDIASSVGLGWSLNYGGMVSRQIREGADEEGTYGYLNNNIYNGFFEDNEKRKSVMTAMNTAVGSGNQYDFVPDQFYFSIADYSGKFILDRYDKKAVQQPYSDIKVETDWSQGSVLHTWIITDTKGNKYYYGRNKEKNHDYISTITARSFRQNHPNNSYIDITNAQKEDPDTWYLQKIVTPYNDTIKYNYTFDNIIYHKKNYDQQVAPCLAPCDTPPDVGAIYTFFSEVQENKYSLESIEFPEGKIQFIIGANSRQDVKYGFPLEKIIVYDKYNRLIESHTLSYNYVDAVVNPASTNITLTNLDKSSKKRMFLSEIRKEALENNSIVLIEKTKYNYDSHPLPDRFSTSKDLWGYFNNENNGTFDHFYDYQGNITNRTTNEIYSKSGILTSIELPTGEVRKFEYENNLLLSPYFNYNKIAGLPNIDGSGNKYGPGQRIKVIKYYDGQELKFKKTYEYTNDMNSNSGRLFGMREYKAILGYKSFTSNATPIPILDPAGVASGDLNSALESRDFGYSYVKEYFGDPSNNTGKIDYIFTNHPDTWNFAEYPFHWANDNNWMRGFLLNQKYYENKNNVYVLVKEISNHYKIGSYDYDDVTDVVGPLPGFTFAFPSTFNYEKTNYLYKMPLARIYLDNRVSIGLAAPPLNSPYLISSNNNLYWSYKPYFFTGGKAEKDKTTVTIYKDNNQITTQADYIYPSYSNNISSIKNTDTDGKVLENYYNYAHEKGNQKLINANMIGIALETSVTKKQNASDPTGKIISKTETKYDDPVTLFPTSVLSYDLQNNSPSTEITYDKYDAKGNLQQYTTKEGISTVIIWGYNNTKPIAKIEGAKLVDISQSLINNIVTASDADGQLNTDASDQSLNEALDLFRNNAAFSGYQISTYTYDPLIGVRSITPPSGIREVYMYDTANRLKEIRENNATGKLLKEYQYNYKN